MKKERETLWVIWFPEKGRGDSPRLSGVLAYALGDLKYRRICGSEELEAAAGEEERPRRLLFVLDLGKYGVSEAYFRLLSWLRLRGKGLEGCVAGMVVDADSDLHTKAAARELAFAANCAGCAFVGRPLVEGTGSLMNFSIVAKNMGTDLEGAYRESARLLACQILDYESPGKKRPNLLALHASSHKNSNTYAVWSSVKAWLPDCSIEEIGLRNGTLSDCSGCPYRMCLHYGEKGSCFYGGVMVEDVYPAVKKADGILLLAPNYNDALSANLTAFINRLTALFRTTRFYDKALFAIIVSGYSGSDLIAEQMIAALNMNKTFHLPGRFAMMETANQAGEAMALPGIRERARHFAGGLMAALAGEQTALQEGEKAVY